MLRGVWGGGAFEQKQQNPSKTHGGDAATF